MWSNSAPPQSLELAACQQSQCGHQKYHQHAFLVKSGSIFSFQNVACCCLWLFGHQSNCGWPFNRQNFIGVCLCQIKGQVMNENMKMKRETEQKFILPCLCSFHEGLGLYLFGRLRISFRFFSGSFLLWPVQECYFIVDLLCLYWKRKSDKIFQLVENRGP